MYDPAVAETLRTICNRDCPDACGVVENERVVKLAGDPEHPITRGFLCWRTNHFLGLQYGPERLTSPLLRGPDGVHRPVPGTRRWTSPPRGLLAIRAQ